MTDYCGRYGALQGLDKKQAPPPPAHYCFPLFPPSTPAFPFRAFLWRL